MTIKGKKIVSKASGLTGKIVGIEKNSLKITFTQFQDISLPLNRAEELLRMDEETIEEINREIKKQKHLKDEGVSKVQTYMDDYEEGVETEEYEEAPIETGFDDVE